MFVTVSDREKSNSDPVTWIPDEYIQEKYFTMNFDGTCFLRDGDLPCDFSIDIVLKKEVYSCEVKQHFTSNSIRIVILSLKHLYLVILLILETIVLTFSIF